jgi:glucose/mannose-6-phosphate isomerase
VLPPAGSEDAVGEARTAADPLGREAVAAVDPSGQAADVLDLATHLRDALWRVESAALSLPAARSGVLVAGMGGSAIGGLLAAAALGPRLRRPLLAARDHGLPSFADAGWVVLCASYSGETEETLAAFDAAGAAASPRVVATSGGELAGRARREGVPVIPLPGGFQPRAAVGYALVAALEVAAAAGAAPSVRGEVEAAAALAERLAAAWGPDGPAEGEAKALARRLDRTVPIFCGAGLGAAAAYRFKTQCNENAKVPAFAAELPEADHNEIVGWPAAPGLGAFSAVFLEDPDVHPRVAERVALTAELAERAGLPVARVRPPGETRLERLVALVLLGDLVSLYLAVLGGRDPADVAPIVELKAALARS